MVRPLDVRRARDYNESAMIRVKGLGVYPSIAIVARASLVESVLSIILGE